MKEARELLIDLTFDISKCSSSKLVKTELNISSVITSLSNSLISFSIETEDC